MTASRRQAVMVFRYGAILAAALLLASCQDEGKDAIAEAEAALMAEPRPAKVIKISDQIGLLSRRFTGRVEAVQTVDLSFQVAGRLIELPVLESQPITKGDLVARLDPEDYDRAVREAKLRVTQAKRDLDRLETLKERNVISQKSFDDQKNAYDLALEALDAATQNLEYTEIHAPFDGILTRRLIDNFTTVNVGSAVVRVQDVSEVQIDINVPEALFAKVTANLIASVHAEFPSIPGRQFELIYREHSSEVNEVTQTYRVTLAMPPQADVRIYPGMTASVVAKLKPEGLDMGDALLVPSSAVAVDSDRNTFVWKFDGNAGTVAKTPVTVGVVSGDFLPVTSGLSVGDRIVSAGVSYLSEGQKIRPLN